MLREQTSRTTELSASHPLAQEKCAPGAEEPDPSSEQRRSAQRTPGPSLHALATQRKRQQSERHDRCPLLGHPGERAHPEPPPVFAREDAES